MFTKRPREGGPAPSRAELQSMLRPFPEEMPEVGEVVQIAYYTIDHEIIVVEAPVLYRLRSTKGKLRLCISRQLFDGRLGSQEPQMLEYDHDQWRIYNQRHEEWFMAELQRSSQS